MDEPFLEWADVINGWRQQYSNVSPEAMKNFNDVVDPKTLFSHDSPVRGIPLHLGTRKEGGLPKVIIALDALAYLGSLIQQVLPSYLPEPKKDPAPVHQFTLLESTNIYTQGAFYELLQKEKKARREAKRLDRLQQANAEWARAKELVQQGHYIFCSIDIEAYELDHSILLEIGWSLYDASTKMYLDQHYLIDTYRHLENGKFVDDQKLRFQFGTSVWCTLKQAFTELRKDLDWAVARDGGFVLVGHGLDSDLKYLKQQKFLWPGDHLDVNKSALAGVLNTDTIYGASIGDMHNPPSLGNTLKAVGVHDVWCLHNAGNDAHYTMQLLMELVKKSTCDAPTLHS